MQVAAFYPRYQPVRAATAIPAIRSRLADPGRQPGLVARRQRHRDDLRGRAAQRRGRRRAGRLRRQRRELSADRADRVPAGRGRTVDPAHPRAAGGSEAAAVASAQKVGADRAEHLPAPAPPSTPPSSPQQTALLSDQEAALTVQQNRLVASVPLVQALGGGFNADGPAIAGLAAGRIAVPEILARARRSTSPRRSGDRNDGAQPWDEPEDKWLGLMVRRKRMRRKRHCCVPSV